MKKATAIFEEGHHRWYAIARDPMRPSFLIDTNEYLVQSGHDALLTDPGGMEIFPTVFSALAEVVDPTQVRQIFASHQDPDVISSLALWIAFNPNIRCHISRLWETFIPHFGGDKQTLIGMPDEGKELHVGVAQLQAVSAHYLHSSGNFHLYDPTAKILFSGDVGAALLPEDDNALYVKDFDRHIAYAKGFHVRWMGSNQAKRDWCERVSKLTIEQLCPQHGAIYRGADVMRFINWFDELKVGMA